MIRIFRIVVPTTIATLLACEIVLCFACYLGALHLRIPYEYDTLSFLLDERGFLRISIAVVIIILGMYFNDLYDEIRVRSQMLLAQQICLSVGLAFMAQAVLMYGKTGLALPKWVMIEGSAFTLCALFGLRVVFGGTLVRMIGDQRVLFLGNSPITLDIAERLLERPELGFRPVGFLAEGDTPVAQPGARLKCFGRLDEVAAVAEHLRPDLIVVALSDRRTQMPTAALLDLRFSGTRIDEIASLYEMAFGRVCIREIRPSQLIFSPELGAHPQSLRIQWIYSTLLAVIGIIISSPIMLLVAIAVKLTSPGPAWIAQQRVGFEGKVFTLYKFRSMYQDAEARTGAVWATRDDPRITRIGYWLRKLRLDELPQLFNVVRGEMSIVGPRPERPEFVKLLSEQIPYYRQRHWVLPGITGWAQINYRYGDTIEDAITKLEYDLYYIKHLSLSLDLYIMFHTAKTMLLTRGAR